MASGKYDLENDPIFRDVEAARVLPLKSPAAAQQTNQERLEQFRKNKTVMTQVVENTWAPDTLINRVPGAGVGHQVVYEKPWHRMALFLFAARMSIRDVANVLDMSTAAVSDLLHTTWFQQSLTALIEKSGGSDVMELCKAEAINSLQTLIEIRDDGNAPKAVRRQCAMDIIERVHGKALQKVETKHSYASDNPVAEVAALEKQLAVQREQLQKQAEPFAHGPS